MLQVVITITFHISGRVSLQTIAEAAIDEPIRVVDRHVTDAIIMLRKKRADSVALRRGVALLERWKPEVLLETRKFFEQDFGAQNVVLENLTSVSGAFRLRCE